MSLRTKLLIITAVSLMALLIAFFSAWRTAQMSRSFALRQAESGVSQAVREIVRRSNGEVKRSKRPVPPHEKEIYDRYGDDSPTALVALALQGSTDVSAGYCDRGGTPVNFISADSDSQRLSASETQLAEYACRQIAIDPDLRTQTVTAGNDTFVAASAGVGGIDLGDFIGAFALRRMPQASVFGDWLNLLTQAFLLLAAIGLAVFSFYTWRDWQRGMRQVEDGLTQISGNLASRIEPPRTFELGKISRSINDLTANLESNLRREAELERSLVKNEKLAALGRVAAGVAHEVRNPLASMKVKIQLAERNKFDPAQIGRTFDVLSDEIDRVDSMVEKLLDLSRPVKLNSTEFSVAGLIDERLSLMSERFAGSGVRVAVNNGQRPVSVLADRARLAQVVDNLLLNAADAMPEGGDLTVDIAEKQAYVEIIITDGGAGVSAEFRERIFEPFFTTKEQGTGLGLAISREISEAHGGRLYFAERSAGASFIVELPVNPGTRT